MLIKRLLFCLVLPLSLAFALPVLADSKSELALLERDVATRKVSDRTISSLEKIIAKEPENSYAHFLLSECLKQKGYLDLAKEQHDLALRYHNQVAQSLSYIKLKIHSGNLQEAFKMRELVRKSNPNDLTVKLLDALQMAMGGNRTEAEQIYKELLISSHRPLGAATALGCIAFERKDWQRASELAQLDLDESYNYCAANLLKGKALLEMHQLDDAMPYLKRAFDDQPLHPEIVWPLTQSLIKSGNYRDALEPALFALALSPRTNSDMNERVAAAKTIFQNLPRNLTNQGIADASKILEGTTYFPYFQCAVGRVLDRCNRRSDALEHYMLAVKGEHNFVEALYRCGRGMEQVNLDYDRAQRYYAKAADIGPQYAMNKFALDRIESRIVNHKNDLAWQLKDMLTNKKTKLPPVGQMPAVR